MVLRNINTPRAAKRGMRVGLHRGEQKPMGDPSLITGSSPSLVRAMAVRKRVAFSDPDVWAPLPHRDLFPVDKCVGGRPSSSRVSKAAGCRVRGPLRCPRSAWLSVGACRASRPVSCSHFKEVCPPASAWGAWTTGPAALCRAVNPSCVYTWAAVIQWLLLYCKYKPQIF